MPVKLIVGFSLSTVDIIWHKLTGKPPYFSRGMGLHAVCLKKFTFASEIIQMGQYRSNPCEHPVRLVSVLWGKTWYYYLTNVLDPQFLCAQQVCELYRRRWRVEDAFLLSKRLLGLAYLWVGGTNGVQIQIFATWI